MPIITLTSDFGTADPFVGIVKGVILSICPPPAMQIVDLSHDVPAQDVLAGALILESATDYFPDGTIHVAVVDPGVGGRRAAIAVRTDRATFIGPDNGLFSAVLRRHEVRRVVQLTNPAYHLHPTSDTFHGRDIFAPAAAHLAAGVPLDRLGEPAQGIVRLPIPEPEQVGDTLELHVLRIDRFGNLITDLTAQRLAAFTEPREGAVGLTVAIEIAGRHIAGIRRTYADVQPGEPVAYLGSAGRLEIGVRNGRADEHFGLSPGGVIRLR